MLVRSPREESDFNWLKTTVRVYSVRTLVDIQASDPIVMDWELFDQFHLVFLSF